MGPRVVTQSFGRADPVMHFLTWPKGPFLWFILSLQAFFPSPRWELSNLIPSYGSHTHPTYNRKARLSGAFCKQVSCSSSCSAVQLFSFVCYVDVHEDPSAICPKNPEISQNSTDCLQLLGGGGEKLQVWHAGNCPIWWAGQKAAIYFLDQSS